jgi:hypothetical protein
MSEESLRRLLDRLASDSQLVERVKANPEEALDEFGLSMTERVALATYDEDGLRRLAGQDVAGFAAPPIERSIFLLPLGGACF